jgi:hypothetical protein
VPVHAERDFVVRVHPVSLYGGGQNPVGGFLQSRERIAQVALKIRAGGLDDLQVVDAGFDQDGLAGGGDNRGSHFRTGGHERPRMRASSEGNPGPEVLRDFDANLADLRVVGKEVIDEMLRELLDLLDRVEFRQRIDGVLDGVGREQRAVVAGGVAGFKGPLELNADGEVPEIVPVLHAAHLDQAYAGFAITVFREDRSHWLDECNMGAAPGRASPRRRMRGNQPSWFASTLRMKNGASVASQRRNNAGYLHALRARRRNKSHMRC